MTIHEQMALAYLLPANAFWQWQDSGSVIVWRDGPTIAFREEIKLYLARLAPRGLPPLECLLIVLAATKGQLRPTDVSFPSALLADWLARHGLPVATIDALLERGAEVGELPDDVRTTREGKIALVDSVSEGLPRTSPEVAEAVLRWMGGGTGEETFVVEASSPVEVRNQMQALVRTLAGVNAAALRLRMKTGLDAEVRPAELELPPALRVATLLKELVDDAELGGLARLAQRLMAAVSLPRHLADPDEQPVGGVSDISNRGPLDRLLLSELVHDDLTLAVRVAMNEALYLRRESPPRTPPRQRAMLVDVGLRTWGVPRVFGAAVALAFAATSDKQTEIAAFRAAGQQALPLELTSREGLNELLAALEPGLHCGPALEAFCGRWEAFDGIVDPMLITTDETWQDDAFQAALRQAPFASCFIASISRDGRFELIERSRAGAKTLRRAEFDLDKLLAPPPGKKPLPLRDNVPAHLPAIFHANPFPLLVPHPIDVERLWHVEHEGTLAITKDGRLVWWRQPRQGPVQITDRLPHGSLRLAWAECRARTNVQQVMLGGTPKIIHAAVVKGSGLAAHLLTIDLDRLTCEVGPAIALPSPPAAVVEHAGVVLFVGDRGIAGVGLSDGRRYEGSVLPNMKWHSGRFFYDGSNQFACVSVEDGRLTSIPVPRPEYVRHQGTRPAVLSGSEPVSTLVECPGVGPIFILGNGNLYYSATEKHAGTRSGSYLRFVQQSRDGRRVIVRDAQTRKLVMIDLQEPSWTDPHAGADVSAALECEALSFTTSLNITHRFQFATMVGNCVALVTNQTTPTMLAVHYDPHTRRIQLRRSPCSRDKGANYVSFKKCQGLAGIGYEVRVARLRDGSEVFLDSRGLLHLKSSDPDLPELSLVLCEQMTGGWCPDGRLWGAAYFTGTTSPAEDREIYEQVLRPFVARAST